MTDLVPALLRLRARRSGAGPLLTYYEPAVGTRVELSATTLLNWVDKTSHLLDELGVAPGDAVALPLATTAPGHWVTAVWELACWQVGVAVLVGGAAVGDDPAGGAAGAEAARVEAAGGEPALVVSGPDWAAARTSGVEVVACSLHPLGLPLAGDLPPGVLDYALEVRGQSDVYPAVRQPGDRPAWVEPGRRLSQTDLVAAPAGPEPVRRLVRPDQPWSTAQRAVVAPLLGGGSTVLVAGRAGEAELARIRADERVEAGPDPEQ